MPTKDRKHLLILGGTHEARELARRVLLMLGKRVRAVTSLAGRRQSAPEIAGEVRIGGFGGIPGLADYLRSEAVDLVIDATHPFSDTISDHAGAACAGTSVPRLQLLRPLWQIPRGADWIEVENFSRAAELLSRFARRVFLTTGLGNLDAFSGLDGLWFLVRLIDPPTDPPPLANHQLVTGRPPYDLDGELALLREHDIDTLVSKHSGGATTEAKITAAAEANVKIMLISRPPPEPGPVVETVDECMAWIEARL